MENTEILKRIENTVFTRQDVYVAAYSIEDNFRETQMRNLMEKLLRNKETSAKSVTNEYRGDK